MGLIGHWSTEAIKSKENSLKYTELALNVLNEKPSEEKRALREWATDVLNAHSGVRIKAEAREYLIENQIIHKYVDEQWAREFSKAFAQSVTSSDRWKNILKGDYGTEEQTELIEELLNNYYEIVLEKREQLKDIKH
ncbi:hypothetical protein QNZ63_004648 [Vibrio parahaemolyticus]|nr:hypothetical protein [Vibrio parahaemolyticus]